MDKTLVKGVQLLEHLVRAGVPCGVSELARQTGRSSRLGYLLDYLAGGVSYAALFAGMAAGLYHGALGAWVIVLGLGGCASAALAVWLNMQIDTVRGGNQICVTTMP